MFRGVELRCRVVCGFDLSEREVLLLAVIVFFLKTKPYK